MRSHPVPLPTSPPGDTQAPVSGSGATDFAAINGEITLNFADLLYRQTCAMTGVTPVLIDEPEEDEPEIEAEHVTEEYLDYLDWRRDQDEAP